MQSLGSLHMYIAQGGRRGGGKRTRGEGGRGGRRGGGGKGGGRGGRREGGEGGRGGGEGRHVTSPLNLFTCSIYEGAAHNLPDTAAEMAAREILTLAEEANADDLIIALISGRGSALLPCPVDGITLQEKRQVLPSCVVH